MRYSICIYNIKKNEPKKAIDSHIFTQIILLLLIFMIHFQADAIFNAEKHGLITTGRPEAQIVYIR